MTPASVLFPFHNAGGARAGQPRCWRAFASAATASWRAPGALSQILTNLVMNSVIHAYGPEDAGQIRLAFHTEDGYIVVEYSDDGRGVDPGALARIFDPFFTTRRDLGGSGLGLHIVYNLVTQRLGGTIRCDSAPGQGYMLAVTRRFIS